MKKRILAAVLAGAMAMTLVGCGNTTGNDTSSNSGTKIEDVAPPTDDVVVDEPTIEDDVVVDDTIETLPEDNATVEDTTAGEDSSVNKDGTLGTALIEQFNALAADDSKGIADIAEALVFSDVIEFGGATMEVEPGYLMGFTEEIDGFDEGVMFGPVIGSIPFVGYVFTVSGDAEAFLEQITSVSDPRWNICTEADETVSAISGDKVCFIMCSNEEF